MCTGDRDAGPTPAGFLGGQVYWETRKATEDSPLGKSQSPRTPKVKGKSRQTQVSLARRKQERHPKAAKGNFTFGEGKGMCVGRGSQDGRLTSETLEATGVLMGPECLTTWSLLI